MNTILHDPAKPLRITEVVAATAIIAGVAFAIVMAVATLGTATAIQDKLKQWRAR